MERCIFHAIITTGLVSGIARGRYQSALAHALYEAIRTCYTAESRPFLHGEVVAVGLLVQSRYLHRADMEDELLRLMNLAGMPTTLESIGVTGDRAALALHEPVPKFFLYGEHDAPEMIRLIRST